MTNKSLPPIEALSMINTFIKSPAFKELTYMEKKLLVTNRAKIVLQIANIKLSEMENQKNQQKNPMFFYGEREFKINKNKKTLDIKRRVALAGVIQEDGKTIHVGVAVCSENDNFTKFKAHLITVGRARKKPYMMLRIEDGKKPTETFASFAKKYVKGEE